MSLSVKCDVCGKQHRVPERHAGRTLECKNCRASMEVPEPYDVNDDEVLMVDDAVDTAWPPKTAGQHSRASTARSGTKRNETERDRMGIEMESTIPADWKLADLRGIEHVYRGRFEMSGWKGCCPLTYRTAAGQFKMAVPYYLPLIGFQIQLQQFLGDAQSVVAGFEVDADQ